MDVGVDLHKRVTQVAVARDDGRITQHRLVNQTDVIAQFFATLPPSRVAIEATGTWWWFADQLVALGHRPVLSHPKQTRLIAGARYKNDRLDAARLLHLLRTDLLPTVWIPPPELREAREVLRHRVRLVGIRTRIKNQLLAMLARRNVAPQHNRSWVSVRGRRELEALPLASSADAIRRDSLALVRMLDQQIRALDQELARQWGTDPRVMRLQTMPGIGPFAAIALILELGDIARFPTAKHLASYLGLTPRLRASADRVRLGHISKEGNRLLRWVLVIAAIQAARRPGPLRAWYHVVKRRKGTYVARVAVARRLAEIAYHVWKDETDYLGVLRRRTVRG
jgi:transposase